MAVPPPGDVGSVHDAARPIRAHVPPIDRTKEPQP